MVVHKIVNFTWDEWKWVAIIVMLGVVMYWTAIVIEPTYQLLEQAKENQADIHKLLDQGIMQQDIIIENQNNNTERLTHVVNQSRHILDNQVVLIRELGNATSQVTNQSRLLLLNRENIEQILEYFRMNFNETFLEGETLDRTRTAQILGNLTVLKEAIKNLSISQAQ